MLREQPVRSRLRTAQADRELRELAGSPHPQEALQNQLIWDGQNRSQHIGFLQFLCRRESSYLFLPLSAKRTREKEHLASGPSRCPQTQ